ncbi:MAG: hypothetical protein M3Y55_09760, partial [Pseudomonadota bacterium]|nr:hypothetical protein [Pseudomonadota bacterium]
PTARIASQNGQAQAVSLDQLLRAGNTSLDVPLQDQTVVYVPGPVTFNIEVSGAVDHPGELQLNEGDRLSMAIAKAGNSTNTNGDLNNVTVTRVQSDGRTQATTVNLYQELQHGDVTKDLVMQKGDTVFVPQARQGLNSAKSGGGLLVLLTLLSRLVPHL